VKHLKAKTNLHQTVVDRCLKTLMQKQLVKKVASVQVRLVPRFSGCTNPFLQHPTRKLYMIAELEPSIALTGGPWYTDNELDTEFIESLTRACFKFIRDLVCIPCLSTFHLPFRQKQSFPRRRKDQTDKALYPSSNVPRYPTAQDICNTLMKARLTETELSVDHVEMLLNVLILDGYIEKV
jgi:DNA-directed RNA polymerase III subunit RPC6